MGMHVTGDTFYVFSDPIQATSQEFWDTAHEKNALIEAQFRGPELYKEIGGINKNNLTYTEPLCHPL